MNSIKIYLLPTLFLFLFNNLLFSQNDFYNDKKEVEKTIPKATIIDVELINEYTTEKDYNEINNINEVQYNDGSEFYEEEVYADQKDSKRKKNTIAGEIVAEVIFDVFFNAVFIIAACWH